MNMPADIPAVPVEGQSESPTRARDEDAESTRSPEYSQNITSLDAHGFVEYMDEIGWPQDGTFVALLSTVDYHFHQKDGRMVTRKSQRRVATILSLLISELLPFNLPTAYPLPRLPTEIWERIIDWIGACCNYLKRTETFRACILVCRSWHHRARLHLYRNFSIQGDHISKLQTTLRNNSSVSLSRTEGIIVRCATQPISAFFAVYKLQNLTYLRLADLDLTKEHSLITRGPLARSVTQLELLYLHSCTVSNLLRFLNSFHSLTDLLVFFDHPSSLRYSGQILPFPYLAPFRSLKNLRLQVVPGVSKMIEWYIREGCFLIRLKKLGLSWPDHPGGGHLHFGNLVSLLSHCANTLEDLTLFANFSVKEGVTVNEIPDAVVLSSLPNLRRMKWWAGYSGLFQIAAMQLRSIRTPCRIGEVIFSIDDPDGYDRSRDHCKAIDEALTSDNFPSLRSVQLSNKIPFDYFPILQSRKLLNAREW